jgi:hypothetical protein
MHFMYGGGWSPWGRPQLYAYGVYLLLATFTHQVSGSMQIGVMVGARKSAGFEFDLT